MIKKTLYFGNPAYLSFKDEQLVIRQEETNLEGQKSEYKRTIPIEDIGILVLDHSQITLTSIILTKLLENNVALVTSNQSHMPFGLFLPLEMNSTQHERFTHQLEASLPLRKQLWAQTIQQKIRNQATVLSQITGESCKNMLVMADTVKSGDSENKEGQAAAYYWKRLFEKQYPDFTRQRDGGQPNALLNFGYAILRGIIARALVSSGLLPTMGLHHHNRYNAYCLADDIMEPYRPYVDQVVLRCVRTTSVFEDEITKEQKVMLLGIPTLDVKIDGKRSPLMVAATQTAASLYKCFSGEIRKISYPVMETEE
ncbi:MAG: type II CRISPR-associated endonuclease Cas1 [Paludibacteraceae bacterium]|nr:type II CRISPR-associated endonuclease Cas1 [Paludibacteraceae bacterium]